MRPSAPIHIMFDVQTLIELRRLTHLAVSPDASWAAVAFQKLNDDKTKYLNQLMRLDLRSGKSSTLTTGESDRGPAFLHDGRLAFIANRGDDDAKKHAQIFAFPNGIGEPEALTDDALGIQSFVAAKDANVLVCTTAFFPDIEPEDQRKTMKDRKEKGSSALIYTKTPVRFWDHWLPNTHTHVVIYVDGERKDLTPTAGRELEHTSVSISPDGDWVTWTVRNLGDDRNMDGTVVLYHVPTAVQQVVFQEPHSDYGNVCWAPDSKRFACLQSKRQRGTAGRDELHVFDVATRAIEHHATGSDHFLAPIEWVDEHQILMSADADTSHAAYVFDTRNQQTTRITDADAGGAHRSLQVVGGELFGLRSRITHPAEPFRCALERHSTPELITTLSGFELPDGIEVSDHRIKSTDGLAVQYFTVSGGGTAPKPALMWIHGGPVGQWGDDWHWRWNPVLGAQQGYVMVLPNPRGSTGFGHEFVDAIFGNTWGGQCYEDLMAIADEVENRDDVDATKFSAMGGSFGGYMTNWIGTQTERFSRLVTHAGLFDLAMFHGVTDLPAWWAHAFNVAPYRERSSFAAYSPVEHIQDWKTPTLVIHGDLDYRVPVGEALALFEGLQEIGVDSKLLIFPDENHWILKPQNILVWYDEVFRFLGQS